MYAVNLLLILALRQKYYTAFIYCNINYEEISLTASVKSKKNTDKTGIDNIYISKNHSEKFSTAKNVKICKKNFFYR